MWKTELYLYTLKVLICTKQKEWKYQKDLPLLK
jgi:hypothetical protein